MNNEKPVEIGEKIRLSHGQFRLLTAMAVLAASLCHLLPDAGDSAQVLEVLFSRQVGTVMALAALLWFVFLGLSSYKSPTEMRQVERCAILFWASYAGSAIGPLLGG